ncbi:MAG: hypothetical protein ACUZ8H_01615 [Candidatus Anammoxibacter sp.]
MNTNNEELNLELENEQPKINTEPESNLPMSNELSLFGDMDWGIGAQEVDDTQIKMTLLYYDFDDYKEFKRLSKIAISRSYGKDKFEKGNLSDILLIILKENYGQDT